MKTLEEKFQQLEFRMIALEKQWGVYEASYALYIMKKDRIALWWGDLYRKVTCKGPRTKKDTMRRIQKKMGRVFYEGGSPQ